MVIYNITITTSQVETIIYGNALIQQIVYFFRLNLGPNPIISPIAIPNATHIDRLSVATPMATPTPVPTAIPSPRFLELFMAAT